MNKPAFDISKIVKVKANGSYKPPKEKAKSKKESKK